MKRRPGRARMEVMADSEEMTGEGGGAEHLTHSQIKERAQSYDPALFADQGVSEEDFNSEPSWRREKMVRLASRASEHKERAAKAEGAVEQMRRELAELKSSLQASANKQPEPEPKGWDAVPNAKLEDYVTLAEKTMHAALLSPENEEIRKQAANIDPVMLATARRELAKRDALGGVAEKEKTWAAEKSKEREQGALLSRLRSDFGDDAVNPRSELLRSAAEELKEMAEERRLFGENAAAYMAVQRAHQRLNGRNGRAMTDSERARLGIEATVRREASPLNEIEALRQRGDWKSRGLATEKSLDMFLDQFTQG